MLKEEVRELLLKTARERIECRLGIIDCDNRPELIERIYQRHPELTTSCGVFVTLKLTDPIVGERLRGCIGSIIGREPLYEGVRRLSVESAFHDPRFSPLTEEEIPWLSVEISVLTPPEYIPSTEEITLGTDGVILDYHGRVAVFLPQVATEQGWDLETMLSHLSMKAGLSADAWREADCRFQTFQAEVFGESE